MLVMSDCVAVTIAMLCSAFKFCVVPARQALRRTELYCLAWLDPLSLALPQALLTLCG